MSIDWFTDVLEFHCAMDIHVGTVPELPSQEVRLLRGSLEVEEWQEMYEAEVNNNMPALADSIADLIYVLIGRAISYGIDLRPVWDAVQKANMAKVGGPVRADGKRLKPAGWQPPDIAGILAKQKPLQETGT